MKIVLSACHVASLEPLIAASFLNQPEMHSVKSFFLSRILLNPHSNLLLNTILKTPLPCNALQQPLLGNPCTSLTESMALLLSFELGLGRLLHLSHFFL